MVTRLFRHPVTPWLLPLLATLIGGYFIQQSPVSLPSVLTAGVLFSMAISMGLHRAKHLPWLLYAGLISGQLLRIRLSGDSSGSLLLIDAAAIAFVVFGLIQVLIKKVKAPLPVVTLPIALFITWMIVTLAIGTIDLAPREILSATFYLLRFLLMLGVGYVAYLLSKTPNDDTKIINTLMLTGIVLTVLGFIQLVFVPNFAFMSQYGWDPHEGRLLSTFFDPNFFGMFLVIIFSLLLSRILTKRATTTPILFIGLLCIILAAIILTFSRSTYLALLVAMVVILSIRAWQLMLIAMIIIGSVSFAVPRVKDRLLGALQIDATAQDRIQSWSETWTIIKDNPITGVGYNAFGPAQVTYGFKTDLQGHSARGSDSSLLLVLATTGIVGAILYTLIFVGLGVEAYLLYRYSTTPLHKAIALSIFGILPSYLIHSQFVNSLFYPLVFIPFLLVVSVMWRGLTTLRK